MTVIITGASGGIGLGIAKELVSRGHTVYSFSRTAPSDTTIKHIQCDVTKQESIKAAFKQFFASEERIDLLVNNAGIGISGAAEFASAQDMKEIFDTNFFGAVWCSQQVIPKMREQKRGKIVFISSVGSIFTLPFQTFYSATKTAVNSFAEGLAMELKPFGIQVGTIMPGDISSNFTANRKKDDSGEDIYKNRVKRSVSLMEKDELCGPSAYKAGNIIAKYLTKRKLKIHKVIGFKYKMFCGLDKVLPRRAIISILSDMYG